MGQIKGRLVDGIPARLLVDLLYLCTQQNSQCGRGHLTELPSSNLCDSILSLGLLSSHLSSQLLLAISYYFVILSRNSQLT